MCYAQRLTAVSAMTPANSWQAGKHNQCSLLWDCETNLLQRCAAEPSHPTCYIFRGKETRSSSFSATQNIQAFHGNLTFLAMDITLTEGWWTGPLLQLVNRRTNLARGLCGLPPLACTQDFSAPTDMGFQVKRCSTLEIFLIYFLMSVWDYLLLWYCVSRT